MNPKFLKLDANLGGRDFVVGDIHGHIGELRFLLQHVSFDYSVDRMFSVGDLIDHGPDSPSCLRLINEPWFHATRGNHEDMMIRAVERKHPGDDQLWIQSGGYWLDLDSELAMEMSELAVGLPVAIQVAHASAGSIGVTHADVLSKSWKDNVAMLDSEHATEEWIADTVWSRELGESVARDVAARDDRHVGECTIEGIDRLYIGHTPWACPEFRV